MRIITVGREFGSGGHEVAKRLAERLGVPFYDEEIIARAAAAAAIISIIFLMIANLIITIKLPSRQPR